MLNAARLETYGSVKAQVVTYDRFRQAAHMKDGTVATDLGALRFGRGKGKDKDKDGAGNSGSGKGHGEPGNANSVNCKYYGKPNHKQKERRTSDLDMKTRKVT